MSQNISANGYKNQTGGQSVVVSVRLPRELVKKIDYACQNGENTVNKGKTAFIEEACRYYLSLESCAHCGKKIDCHAMVCPYCGRALPEFEKIFDQLKAAVTEFSDIIKSLWELIHECSDKVSKVEYFFGAIKNNTEFDWVLCRAKLKTDLIKKLFDYLDEHESDEYELLERENKTQRYNVDELVSSTVARDYLLALKLINGEGLAQYTTVNRYLYRTTRNTQWIKTLSDDVKSIIYDLDYIDNVVHSEKLQDFIQTNNTPSKKKQD